jgi:tetraacyldisaccharide 4'-kinase
VWIIYKTKKPQDFGVRIIGVGNLNVGGSGKTPFVTALAKKTKDAAVILRGYGRNSKGMIVVKDKQNILVDVDTSGDEAMIYATKLRDSVVIVSEDRKKAILKAKQMGIKVVFLDDAYSKHNIKKTDILIETDSKNTRCLPSGPFRERLWSDKEVIVVKEDIDFKREVKLLYKTKKMSFVTAIARPQRVDKYLPEVVSKNYFEDHHNFTKEELEDILKRDASESLLVTYKDYVKIQRFGLKLSLLDLELDIKNIEKYII